MSLQVINSWIGTLKIFKKQVKLLVCVPYDTIIFNTNILKNFKTNDCGSVAIILLILYLNRYWAYRIQCQNLEALLFVNQMLKFICINAIVSYGTKKLRFIESEFIEWIFGNQRAQFYTCLNYLIKNFFSLIPTINNFTDFLLY